VIPEVDSRSPAGVSPELGVELPQLANRQVTSETERVVVGVPLLSRSGERIAALAPSDLPGVALGLPGPAIASFVSWQEHIGASVRVSSGEGVSMLELDDQEADLLEVLVREQAEYGATRPAGGEVTTSHFP
jgi:hypothetical protein